jgi:hypothetical protein
MSDMNLVIVQNREKSGYNDFVGKYYHFHKKDLHFFSDKGSNFVYFEPNADDNGLFFGCGKIGKKPILIWSNMKGLLL